MWYIAHRTKWNYLKGKTRHWSSNKCTIQKNGKLPLYPKTCVKLIGYGNKTINYLGTTKLKCNHSGAEIEAIFYVTDVLDTKIIHGL